MSKNHDIIPLTRVTHTTANGDKVTRSFKTSTGRDAYIATLPAGKVTTTPLSGTTTTVYHHAAPNSAD